MRLSNVPDVSLYEGLFDVSFTGTRYGMTKKQRKSLLWLLRKLDGKRFHHGDCIGSDEQAAKMAWELGMDVLKYPSTASTRAYSPFGICAQDPKHPLERNKDIVNIGDCLIACPQSLNEELRSGTWHAVRYARKENHLIWFVWLDGSITEPDL